jgi:hypothetical protein
MATPAGRPPKTAVVAASMVFKQMLMTSAAHGDDRPRLASGQARTAVI